MWNKGPSLAHTVVGKLASVPKLSQPVIPKSPGNIKGVGVGKQFNAGPVPDPGGTPQHYTFRDLRLINHDDPLNNINKSAALPGGGMTAHQSSSTGGSYAGGGGNASF